jgi:hypothetical protein
MRDHDASHLTDRELDRGRRELAASPALSRPGSPVRAPIQADAELAERAKPPARAVPDQGPAVNRYRASRQGDIRLNKSAHPGWAMTVDAGSLTEPGNRINAQKEYEQNPSRFPENL